jgi:hypothetical protein
VHLASAGGGSNQPVKYYGLGREGMDIVSMKCRANDLPVHKQVWL